MSEHQAIGVQFSAATIRLPGVQTARITLKDPVADVIDYIDHCEAFEGCFVLAQRNAEESDGHLVVGIEVEP
jgi:hypothetical protein